MKYQLNATGLGIESESFAIIKNELGPVAFSQRELDVVIRAIHASGDFDYANILRFIHDPIEAGISALDRGCEIFTDVNMLKAGISSRFITDTQERVICLIDTAEVRSYAETNKVTRATAQMRMQKERLDGAIVAIGNAPTALLEVLRLSAEEGIRPALVIGTPVGFVNAAESKDLLAASDLPAVTCLGRKGGSSIAAAIMNAIAKLANSQEAYEVHNSGAVETHESCTHG